MSVKVSVVGVGKFNIALDKINDKIKKALLRGTFRGGLLVQKTSRLKVLHGPRSGKGRLYRKSKNVTHRASAPGEPPANDTGNLARSINILKSTDNGVAAVCEVQAQADYAYALEFGTTKAGASQNVVIEPRPFMTPSAAENSEAISKILEEELRKVK